LFHLLWQNCQFFVFSSAFRDKDDEIQKKSIKQNDFPPIIIEATKIILRDSKKKILEKMKKSLVGIYHSLSVADETRFFVGYCQFDFGQNIEQ
jgi:hypothetical protein